ncbi:MAG: DUF3592 domain-containing protein [Cryomorphaceae bacterium]
MYFIPIFGLLFVFIGIRNHKKQKQLMKTGVRFTAEIVDLHEDMMNNRTIYYPVVRVIDEVEGTKDLRMPTGTSMRKKVGSKIDVVYDPTNFNDVHEYSNTMTLANVMFIIVGSIFTLIGIIVIALNLFWDHITSN